MRVLRGACWWRLAVLSAPERECEFNLVLREESMANEKKRTNTYSLWQNLEVAKKGDHSVSEIRHRSYVFAEARGEERDEGKLLRHVTKARGTRRPEFR